VDKRGAVHRLPGKNADEAQRTICGEEVVEYASLFHPTLSAISFHKEMVKT
jgi:hypothetical protein